MEHIEHTRKGVFIQGLIPGRLLARYNGFQASAPTDKLTDADLLDDPDYSGRIIRPIMNY